MSRILRTCLCAVAYVWTFWRTYRWARRRMPGLLQLEAAIARHLSRTQLTSTPARSGLYAQEDNSVTRSEVAAFYRMAALHCFLGRQYADLRGIRPTPCQWEALAAIGALAKIQDYLVDRLPNFPQAEQDRIYANPHGYRPTCLAAALFQEVLLHLIRLMPRDSFPEYHRVLEEIYAAQIVSRRQRDADVTLEELRTITMQKGGYGILAGLHVLNPHLTPKDPEYQALLSIGHWGQMVEDVLDEREDRREGNHTLVSRMHPGGLADEIVARRNFTMERIGALTHYPVRQREVCLYRIFLPSVPAIARLRQLAEGRDIYHAWENRQLIPTAAMAVDFVRKCLAQMAEFEPTEYLATVQTSDAAIYNDAA